MLGKCYLQLRQRGLALDALQAALERPRAVPSGAVPSGGAQGVASEACEQAAREEASAALIGL